MNISRNKQIHKITDRYEVYSVIQKELNIFLWIWFWLAEQRQMAGVIDHFWLIVIAIFSFQPEVGKFHESVLPTLLTFLQTVIKDGKDRHKGTLTKLFYAIEKLTESLGNLNDWFYFIFTVTYFLMKSQPN